MPIRCALLFLLLLGACDRRVHREITKPSHSSDSERAEILVIVLRELMDHSETPFKNTAAVYFVSAGEFPAMTAIDEALLKQIGPRVAPVRGASPEIFKAERRQVFDPQTGRNALLFFAQVYLCDTAGKAFAIGGSYAHSMSLQRYVFELRRGPGGWRVWNYARWGGEGYATISPVTSRSGGTSPR